MPSDFSIADWIAYLDEALPVETMSAIESALREDPHLVEQLTAAAARRDAGVHSLGEIWRRNRLTCPSRTDLGNYLLKLLPDEVAKYIRFHLEAVGCRQCQANLDDLRNRQAESAQASDARRRKYFQSSAGYLGGRK